MSVGHRFVPLLKAVLSIRLAGQLELIRMRFVTGIADHRAPLSVLVGEGYFLGFAHCMYIKPTRRTS
jgi:hypothetical protein